MTRITSVGCQICINKSEEISYHAQIVMCFSHHNLTVISLFNIRGIVNHDASQLCLENSSNPRFCSDCDILTHAFWDAFFRSPPQFTRSFSGMECPFLEFSGSESRGRHQFTALKISARTDNYQKGCSIFSTDGFCCRTRYVVFFATLRAAVFIRGT